MSSESNGRAAFAATATSASDDVYHQPGMSLRDYFAAAALTGLGTWIPEPRIEDGDDPKRTDRDSVRTRRARWAYAQADALLAAREVKHV